MPLNCLFLATDQKVNLQIWRHTRWIPHWSFLNETASLFHSRHFLTTGSEDPVSVLLHSGHVCRSFAMRWICPHPKLWSYVAIARCVGQCCKPILLEAPIDYSSAVLWPQPHPCYSSEQGIIHPESYLVWPPSAKYWLPSFLVFCSTTPWMYSNEQCCVSEQDLKTLHFLWATRVNWASLSVPLGTDFLLVRVFAFLFK